MDITKQVDCSLLIPLIDTPLCNLRLSKRSAHGAPCSRVQRMILMKT
jgi:hypothetical protein